LINRIIFLTIETSSATILGGSPTILGSSPTNAFVRQALARVSRVPSRVGQVLAFFPDRPNSWPRFKASPPKPLKPRTFFPHNFCERHLQPSSKKPKKAVLNGRELYRNTIATQSRHRY